ncbi:MAG: GNAT family N-acetyltransferase [candidate division Zixibacteria bacterium]|nr:GNAT family N-acetyltransferase [candidate division Zixibacteria bacterium]
MTHPSQSPQSTRLKLTSVADDHLRVFHRWFHNNAPERQTCRPISKKTADELVTAYRNLPESETVGDFSVVRLRDEELVGRVRYFDLNWRNRSAEIGYVIGPTFQGEGYATEALELLLALLFDGHSLNKVYAQTAEFNEASVALLQHWGFKQDGRLRQHHELNGEFHDDLIFSLLAAEYKQIIAH